VSLAREPNISLQLTPEVHPGCGIGRAAVRSEGFAVGGSAGQLNSALGGKRTVDHGCRLLASYCIEDRRRGTAPKPPGRRAR
jgi:hypothetical protein